MSGIAELLINLGYKVSGSDLKDTAVTRRLLRWAGIFIKDTERKMWKGPMSSSIPRQ